MLICLPIVSLSSSRLWYHRGQDLIADCRHSLLRFPFPQGEFPRPDSAFAGQQFPSEQRKRAKDVQTITAEAHCASPSSIAY